MKVKYKKEGDYFRMAREEAGLTQREVALKMGIKTVQYISNVERGHSRLPSKYFGKAMKVFGEKAIQRLVDTRVNDFRASLTGS